jgi:hypothetical protein
MGVSYFVLTTKSRAASVFLWTLYSFSTKPQTRHYSSKGSKIKERSRGPDAFDLVILMKCIMPERSTDRD